MSDYRLGTNGYMVHRSIPRKYEHRDVWIAAHGPIPRDHHIHHKNKDRTDNRLENLECIEKHAHMRLHGITFAQINSWVKRKAKLKFRSFECVSCGKESTSWHPLAKTCSRACRVKYNNWLQAVYRGAKREAKLVERACRFCGTNFIPNDAKRIYCSHKCTNTAANSIRHNRVIQERLVACHG
jgi:hypothetical protein